MNNQVANVIYLGVRDGFDAVHAILSEIANVKHIESSQGAVSEALKWADYLLDASMKVKITDLMVSNAPNLKLISCATTGSDHIERGSLNAKGISVRTLKDDREMLQNITPAAELSWALLLACARNLKGAFTHTQGGKWVREDFPGVMLNGKTLGLIGCGRIGGWMARYAQAFGMTVLAYDPFQDELPVGVSRCNLNEMVGVVDFLSIHVHLSDATRGIISRSLIDQFKSNIIFINTSRGALVDESALLDALRMGKIAAAGVDVVDGEPEIQNHPMIAYAAEYDNLIITPHCGGFSPDAVKIVCRHAAEKIKNAILS